MPDSYWVVAEINDFQVNTAGHCFMELIEKSHNGGQITAKARATIWAYHFRMLAPYFETTTNQRLSAGLKIMLQASVEYHEIYGLSLHVIDINPAFTIGDLAMKRQTIIQQLIDEGVFDMNRELTIPMLPQRIAVISSETAAGYGDFVNQLYNNPHGYDFSHTLFQAVMQGNEAETSIIGALEEIFDLEDMFDIVVLIRGGGSQSDLNCFNNYQLAACIAQFPLPVITGIGHERDETVADLVAYAALKTPTAVADFIVHQALNLHVRLQELEDKLADTTEFLLRQNADKLRFLSQRLLTIIHSHARKQDREIHVLLQRLNNAANNLLLQKKMQNLQIEKNMQTIAVRFLHEQKTVIPWLYTQLDKVTNVKISLLKNQIVRFEDKLHLLDPVNLLQRGYSITLFDGKVVRNTKAVKRGQLIETLLYDGKIESIVE